MYNWTVIIIATCLCASLVFGMPVGQESDTHIKRPSYQIETERIVDDILSQPGQNATTTPKPRPALELAVEQLVRDAFQERATRKTRQTTDMMMVRQKAGSNETRASTRDDFLLVHWRSNKCATAPAAPGGEVVLHKCTGEASQWWMQDASQGILRSASAALGADLCIVGGTERLKLGNCSDDWARWTTVGYLIRSRKDPSRCMESLDYQTSEGQPLSTFNCS